MERLAWLALVAAALFVYGILQNVLRKWISDGFDHLGKAIYRRMAASRLFRSAALRRYREGVMHTYERAHVPFLNEEMAIRDVYVPLTAISTGRTRTEHDAGSLVATKLRAVVTGDPGAGKSMLLRHAMLAWAMGGSPTDNTLVLYELHRHNGNKLTIEELLANQFDLMGFPRAQRFIERALSSGRMTVLLDGFDEVNTSDRWHVAELIRDFGTKYANAHIVVTCRSAVYGDQLAPVITQRYAVGEFDERMIRRFLTSWPGMTSPSRLEQLMETLREAPRVMTLARNPLLLTMIAYLYAYGDEHRQLPHSRAAFYREATQYLLLQRFKDVNIRFDAPMKMVVLQRLALAYMEAPPGTPDHLTLPAQNVIDLVTTALSGFKPAPPDAKPILTEIVERSGLLLAIDGGFRYQFAHLTLQEFLAARELKALPSRLIEQYRTDPTRWRECAKLWCGVTDDDCTETIRTIHGLDRVLGLECLADVREVDGALADQMIDEMFPRMVEPAVIKAFGLVASDPRPRGAAVLERISELARSGSIGAIAALAATNTPKACAVIAELAPVFPAAREALVRMGDLSIDILVANTHKEWAIDGLARIATPAAIEGLVASLQRPGATRAAWHLASLMRDNDAMAAMSSISFIWGTTDRLWFWEPFHRPDDGDIAHIIAAMGDLLTAPGAELAKPHERGKLDPRIVVPLWISAPKPSPLSTVGKGVARGGRRRRFAEGPAMRLLDELEPSTSAILMDTVLAGRPATRQQWVTARRPNFQLDGSWYHLIAFMGIIAFPLAALVFGLAVVASWFPAWGPARLAWTIVVVDSLAVVLVPTSLNALRDAEALSNALVGLSRFFQIVWDDPLGHATWSFAVAGVAFPLSAWVTLMNLQLYVGWGQATAYLFAAALVFGGIFWAGWRKQRRSENPLRPVVARMDIRNPTSLIR